MKPMGVYIAGPMTNGTAVTYDLPAIHRAIKLHCLLVGRGYMSICPQLSMLCPLVSPEPTSYSDWLRLDRQYIDQCDVVVRMSGPSVGARDECQYAHRQGKTVICEDEVDKILPPLLHDQRSP